MKERLALRGAVSLLVLVLLLTMLAGCKRAPDSPKSTGEIEVSELVVPDVPLDAFIYLQQEKETRIPVGTMGISQDIEVVSMSVWGVPYEESDFSFGVAFNFGSEVQAAEVYAGIGSAVGGTWVEHAGKTVFLVNGTGPAAATLRAALQNRKFKTYDDADGLTAAQGLPDGGDSKMVALALVRPSPALLRFVTESNDNDTVTMVTGILGLMRLKMGAVGGYAEHHLDGVQLIASVRGGSIDDSGLSVIGIVNANLPGVVVGPLVERLLPEQGFRVETSGDEKYFLKAQPISDGGRVYLALMVDGSRLVMAISAEDGRSRELVRRAM